jgi:hypothetical protein
MIPFPCSLLLLPLVAALGVVYVTAGAHLPPGGRKALRVGLVGTTWALPLLVPGPGPAKLIVGLLVGFWGIRMVALGRAARRPRQRPDGTSPTFLHSFLPTFLPTFLALVTPDDLFTPRPTPKPRPDPGGGGDPSRRSHPRSWGGWIVLAGLALLLGCVGLVWAGSVWRLWRWSRLADDLLVLVEVAIGAAGVHRLIVGIAEAIGGHPVAGLQDHPLRAASLSEFWSSRWNRLVQRNLERAFFRPVGRRAGGKGDARRGQARRSARAVLAAFGASGVMHAIAVGDLVHPRETALPTAAVMTFFLLHGALVSAERALGLVRTARTPRGLMWARLRTLALFALLSPLLLDPFARVAGVHGRGLATTAAASRPERR